MRRDNLMAGDVGHSDDRWAERALVRVSCPLGGALMGAVCGIITRFAALTLICVRHMRAGGCGWSIIDTRSMERGSIPKLRLFSLCSERTRRHREVAAVRTP